jgi:hypothetical protein
MSFKLDNINDLSLNIIIGCIVLYIIILPYIDYELLNLINSIPIKLLFTGLIIYATTNNLCSISIMILLIYILSVQQFNNKENTGNIIDVIDFVKNKYESFAKTARVNKNANKFKKNDFTKVEIHKNNIMKRNYVPPKLLKVDKASNDNYDNIDNWSMFTPIVPPNKE